MIKPTKSEPKCPACYGCGWHPLGYLCPIGPLDAQEWGNEVIKCPWCNAGSVASGDRWDELIKAKTKYDKEKSK